MWFRHRQRIDAAFAKGLMFGKAVGKRDELERIIAVLEDNYESVLDTLGMEYGLQEADILLEILERIRGEKND